jgi:hypothetical protein
VGFSHCSFEILLSQPTRIPQVILCIFHGSTNVLARRYITRSRIREDKLDRAEYLPDTAQLLRSDRLLSFRFLNKRLVEDVLSPSSHVVDSITSLTPLHGLPSSTCPFASSCLQLFWLSSTAMVPGECAEKPAIAAQRNSRDASVAPWPIKTVAWLRIH